MKKKNEGYEDKRWNNEQHDDIYSQPGLDNDHEYQYGQNNQKKEALDVIPE